MPALEQRPDLSPGLTASELHRWYWTLAELQVLARELRIRPTGAKRVLTARIAAALQHQPFDEPPTPDRPITTLIEPLGPATVLPTGQRCSQQVRAWMTGQVGPAFRFDKHMRAFFAGTDGTQTLDDALRHWRSTRAADRDDEIEEQFELNRFTRRWHRDHPGRTRSDLLDAWREYRSRPSDRREQV